MKKIQIETKPFKGIRIPHWPVTEMCGYEPKTTFWQDFWIAIYFGKDAVQDTYDRAFNEWKNDIVYVTEMVMVLNHIGDMLYNSDRNLSEFFYGLYEQLNDWCWENLSEDDREYYFRVTD